MLVTGWPAAIAVGLIAIAGLISAALCAGVGFFIGWLLEQDKVPAWVIITTVVTLFIIVFSIGGYFVGIQV